MLISILTHVGVENKINILHFTMFFCQNRNRNQHFVQVWVKIKSTFNISILFNQNRNQNQHIAQLWLNIEINMQYFTIFWVKIETETNIIPKSESKSKPKPTYYPSLSQNRNRNQHITQVWVKIEPTSNISHTTFVKTETNIQHFTQPWIEIETNVRNRIPTFDTETSVETNQFRISLVYRVGKLVLFFPCTVRAPLESQWRSTVHA